MRAIRKSWIGIALAILFGISLFFFRGSSRYSNLFNSDNIVASISGTPVSTSKFVRVLEGQINQFAQILGKNLSGDEIRDFQIHQIALQNLINSAVFENEFEKINYVIDKTTIAQNTKRRFPYLYVNNELNEESLNEFLRQQRLKIDDLVNIISFETRANVFDDLFFNKYYPMYLNEKISRLNNQTRTVNLVTLPIDNIINNELNKSLISKNNPDLLQFIEDNSNQYMTNEIRDISYIIINKNNFSDLFTPSNIEIDDYYNNNQESFIIPERRSFRQFNFKTKDEVDQFYINTSSLSTNEIIDYANQKNINYNEFNDLNKNQVLEELSNVIFSQEKNTLSEIIKTDLAYHLIILDEIKESKIQSIEDSRENIKNTLTEVQLNNYFNDLKLQIEQQILQGYSLEEIANENSLELIKKDGISNTAEQKEDIFLSIINSAFTLNKNFVSDVIDYDSEISYLINVDMVYPPTMRDLDSIYGEALEDFVRYKNIEYVKNIYEINKENNNLSNLKKVFNVENKIIEMKINEDDQPLVLTRNIFESDINKIIFASDEENIYFAITEKVKIPKDISTSSKINLNSDLKSAFGNEIIKTKKISFNDELINGLLSQYK